MSDLFPRNCYDPNIVNQPEIEYRTAKYPFHVRHRYIDASSGKAKFWDSSHCPVCFWNERIGLWDSVIGKDSMFCKRCGQKIRWDDDA